MINVNHFGTMPDGREVKAFTLKNRNGMEATISEFGALLLSVKVPTSEGSLQDLTLGFDDLSGWMENPPYFGATVGRFGNRIANGRFSLEGKEYDLVTNNEPGGIPCHLHGGTVGFNKVLWTGEVSNDSLELSYHSPDGEEGYPGNLRVKVSYTLDDDNQLTWKATATTDQPTPINIIHHSYWNLSGDMTTSINDHILMLNADRYLPTNKGLIPTGELASVKDTPMDFTQPTPIGERVDAPFQALQFGEGYDHAWVINGEGMRLAAKVSDPKSGRTMEIFTDQPAVQFYGGNFLDGTVTGKDGIAYKRRTGLCLETEGFPDAPNQPEFPDCILRPGETYSHSLVHRFSW
ncbi:MAG: aldose epimerase family protein [Verrucomicrobiota bacterium JB023]|nr:aldose epimerase family protein [Verrucomicrobiota bacterium JB023]